MTWSVDGPDRHRGEDAPDGKTEKQLDSELVWLITMYVLYVWNTFQIPSRHIPDMSDTL